MNLLHLPRFQRWVSRHQLCRVEGPEDRFALTFDDGPSPTNTPALLDLLARHAARATFFVLGPHVRRHPGLVRRMIDEGHEVGMHGHHHVPPLLFSSTWLRGQVRRAEAAIADAAGASPLFYRAPFGLLSPAQARLVRAWGFVPVLGDVYPEDAARPGAERIATETLARLRPGSILILHDSSVIGDGGREQTIAAMERILSTMCTRGIRPVTLRDLIATSHEAPDAKTNG